MSHEGQKRLNKIATLLRANEFWLYGECKTDTEVPGNDKGHSLINKIMAYCDTADTGDDYLCCIIFVV